jgi:arylsulfatase A-like enzyme
MNEIESRFATLLPRRRDMWRGLAIAVGLWFFFMIATAYTSAATLLDRVASTDVMKAASGNAWSSVLVGQTLAFLAAQLVLHLAFALLCWLLACATVVIAPKLAAKFGRIVVGWFCILASATLIYNALWYPRTLFGAYYHDAVSLQIGSLHIGQLVYYVAFAFCVLILLLACLRLFKLSTPAARRICLTSSVVVAIALIAVALWPDQRSAVAAAHDSTRPNVILIGIDSLRLDELKRFGGTGLTPNLDRFLEEADLFADATTPAARTFSSWVAILTGRAPPLTGARFNLGARSSVLANPTIADVLRKTGYHTVYSTDEVRFANIDESYGFDQVVTPKIGASDFLIGTYNELPLASMVINTRAGKWLFPFSHGNRGVATMFEPETFLARIDRELQFTGPTFFISHLTAAHWPYYTADTPFGIPMSGADGSRPMYSVGLKTADRMFGELIRILEAKGALNNAIVVLLSDHGEALGLPGDSFAEGTFQVDGLLEPLRVDVFGHGQSVLSQSQYQVLLGIRSFGSKTSFGAGARKFETPITVEDIAPTILQALDVPGDPLTTSGTSFLPYLQTGQDGPVGGPERIRFTETDLRVLPAPDGGVDEIATARENSAFFTVDPSDGRLHVKVPYEPIALAYKERAAFTKKQLLAAMPAGPYAHQYIFIDFERKHGQLLMGRPGNDTPEAQRLWDAMAAHYSGELRLPVATTPADWPRIAEEWGSFTLPQ